METLKKCIIPGLVILVVGAAVGYFAKPAKVVTETKVVTEIKEVIKWKESESKTKNNDKVVIKIETIMPDGTRKIETKIVDKGTITIDKSGEGSSETDTSTTEESKKTVEYAKNDWSLNLLYAPIAPKTNGSLLGLEQTFGVSVNRRILGPIYLGGFGLSNKTLGVSVGLSF